MGARCKEHPKCKKSFVKRKGSVFVPIGLPKPPVTHFAYHIASSPDRISIFPIPNARARRAPHTERSCASCIGYAPPHPCCTGPDSSPFYRTLTRPMTPPPWIVRRDETQHFLNLQEFPGYSSVRPCLVRHVSTLVPYECHVFTGAKGHRITVRRNEVAFFSHCWDLPPDQVCLTCLF